ncbi:MAG: hypothetical protein OZ921_03945 [Sorangiineae bacterium]|nr:hypothetical protein [Sorangiineae bacterium]
MTTNVRRRRVLGYFAGGLAAGAGGLTWLRVSGYQVPADVAERLAVLAPWQYVVVEAFGRRVLAPRPIGIGSYTDEYLRGLAATDLRDVGRFIAYLEHLAPVVAGYARRFTALAPEAQDRVLGSLEESRIELLRAGFQALKAMAMMAYWRRSESWAEIGYGGPVIDWGAE